MLKKATEAIFGDFWLKLTALVISLGIWFYANSRLTEEIALRAVLEVTPPPGYALIHQNARSARVTISGPRSLISRLEGEFGRNQFQLKLATVLTEEDVTNGMASLKPDRRWLRTDLLERELVQLKVGDISPKEVKVFVSPVVERRLPVDVRVSVHPAPGFLLAEPPSATPPEVTVRGPTIALDSMRSVPTVELTLYEDVRSDLRRRVGLETQVPVILADGTTVSVPLEVSPPTVSAHIAITGEPEKEKVFPDVPLAFMQPARFPFAAAFGEGEERVDVIVRASAAELAKIEARQVRAYVDLSSLADEQVPPGAAVPYRERVRVELPPEVVYTTARAEPDRVTVLLKNVARAVE